MELFFLSGIITILAAFVLFIAWKNPLLLLGIHVTSRVLLDGFSDTTYKNIVGIFSFMQLYSFFIVVIFTLYLIKFRKDLHSVLYIAIPAAAVSFTYILSSIMSNEFVPVIENITKWIYMLLMAGVVYEISNRYKLRHLLLTLFLSVSPALIIQLYSILTQDFVIASGGHRAYFGGYYHQNMLSYFILLFIISSLYLALDYKKFFLKAFFIACSMYGITALYLCGYRTTILAAFVMLMVTAILYIKLSKASHKVLAVSTIPLVVIVFFYFVGADLQTKLADLGTFLQSPMSYIDFSGHAKHVSLFSGRLAIMNTLMSSYVGSPLESIIAGLGIESSERIVGTYPHNEYLAALVECGILGLIALCLFTAYYFKSILRCLPSIRIQETVFIGAGTGMFAMTLATMPFRDMRAMLVFGLLLGITHFIHDRGTHKLSELGDDHLQTPNADIKEYQPNRPCTHSGPLSSVQESPA